MLSDQLGFLAEVVQSGRFLLFEGFARAGLGRLLAAIIWRRLANLVHQHCLHRVHRVHRVKVQGRIRISIDSFHVFFG